MVFVIYPLIFHSVFFLRSINDRFVKLFIHMVPPHVYLYLVIKFQRIARRFLLIHQHEHTLDFW
jgi:hypothetical protein